MIMTKPAVKLSTTGLDGKEWAVYACPACRHAAPFERMAEECCAPKTCECGAECPRPYILCNACRDAKRAAQERERFKKARKVSWRDHSGPVCVDGDRYYGDVDELVDAHECDGAELPEYAWACTVRRLSLCADDVLDWALESGEHHEGARDQVDDVEGLQKLLDEWCDRQSVESWFESHEVAVLLEGAGYVCEGCGAGPDEACEPDC